MPKLKKTNFLVLKTSLLLSVVLLIVLLIAGYIYADRFFERPYYAVHFVNGDTYFGQLYRFPRLELGDVHVIQPVPDAVNPEQTTLQVVPLNAVVFWGPDRLTINREQVIFTAKVGEDSQILKIIEQSKSAGSQL